MKSISSCLMALSLITGCMCDSKSVAVKPATDIEGSPGSAWSDSIRSTHKILASCDAKTFLSEEVLLAAIDIPDSDDIAIVAFYKGQKDIELDRVAWKQGADKFELQCFDAAQAKAHREAAESSEGISTSFKGPSDTPMGCYFTDEWNARCWMLDKQSQRLIDAGGWQT